VATQDAPVRIRLTRQPTSDIGLAQAATYRVNAAIEAGRNDLIDGIVAEYAECTRNG
jgi:hypothetical protein